MRRRRKPSSVRNINDGAYPAELFDTDDPGQAWFQRTGR